MRVPRIVMLEPTRQLPHHRLRIRPMCKIGIVALKRSDEALCHPITLRTTQPRRHRLQSELSGKRARLRRRIAATVISQPFQVAGRLAIGTESLLDGLHHQVTHQVGVNALRCRHPAHRFPVTAIQRKGDPHPLTVIAAKLEPIGTPTFIAGVDRNSAIMPTIRHRLVATAMQQQLLISHDSVNALVVRLLAIEPQHRPYTPIAIAGTIPGNLLDRLQQFSIVGPWWRLAPILPVVGAIES